MIDLLALDSVQISRNLKGKFLLIYGAPKVGKTTLLSKLPKSLILAFEPGANALNNAHVQPIKKWTDFKVVLKQLHNPAVQEKFHFIGIDTADSAWDMCEKYVCAQNDVKAISDIPWGKGYSECQKEFSQAFFDLAILQYGICFISHESEKRFKDEQGEEYVQLVPALPTRPYDIVNKLVDIISYIRTIPNPEGEGRKTYMFFRGNDRFLAGARLKYIVDRVEFSYENLLTAVQDAVDKQVEVDGTTATEAYRDGSEEKSRSFNEAMDEAKELWGKITQNNQEKALAILEIVEKVFGKKMKLSDATPQQIDLLELVILEMKDM